MFSPLAMRLLLRLALNTSIRIMKSPGGLLTVFSILFISGCGGTDSPTTIPQNIQLETIVAATLTARVTQVPLTAPATATLQPTEEATITATLSPTPEPTATFTPSPTLPENNVTGKVCFPGGDIPAMSAYFEETENETLVNLPITAGQSYYEVNLPAGTYIAYAWLVDFSRSGLYSRAVPCGLTAGCDDHKLLPFTIKPGEVIEDIDLCDWHAGPFNVPYPPGVDEGKLTGNISGGISYVEDIIPSLRVVAFNQKTSYYYWVHTLTGQASYALTDLPPGSYHMVAYDDDGRAGGHARADHTLVEVVVRAGETTTGIDINDWEAPAGAYPPDPTK